MLLCSPSNHQSSSQLANHKCTQTEMLFDYEFIENLGEINNDVFTQGILTNNLFIKFFEFFESTSRSFLIG